MNFSCLSKILNPEQDLELCLTNPDWELVGAQISVDRGWLKEAEFNQCLGPFIGQEVYAFETFERVYKDTNTQKRLEESFILNWPNFKRFQETTDILFVYLVSEQLNWVFYANRDNWKFAVQP
ncbi:hypothetical protein [Shewanella sedimentimangrovi]|uniref:Uncharacterized protein n=1 Tax=Shewanella sedimentimangrovi TaxID=2814293 RepID=A0ABX7QVS8_9GAMM|nr:hypothetical protein [Shewanella sedimentimangrovi]QSX35613.1 hypothetical protein JYB85_09410 [Shewanella sedimentimangrovi]